MSLTRLRRRIVYMLRRNRGRPVPARRIAETMFRPSKTGSWHEDKTRWALDLMVLEGSIRWVGDRVVETVKPSARY